MKKIKVVLVVLNKKYLNNAAQVLSYNNVFPFVALVEDGDGKWLTVNETLKIPLSSFAALDSIIEVGTNYLWLICGRTDNSDDFGKMKNFLAENGVPEK